MLSRKIYLIIFCLFLTSCGGMEFIYKNQKDLYNPIYNKTKYEINGKQLSAVSQYAQIYFGDADQSSYNLIINISEEKIKKSVKTNQAVSKLDYKIVFGYELIEVNRNCLVYNKDVVSRFSYIPKSSGYNFGSDQSLDNMYKLAVKENFNQFINQLSQVDITSCLDEN